MRGRRRPDNTDPVDFEPGDYGWFRSGAKAQNGLYVFPPRSERYPMTALGRISPKIHNVEEHTDGTITVSPSIRQSWTSDGDAWHGFLKHGEWEEC